MNKVETKKIVEDIIKKSEFYKSSDEELFIVSRSEFQNTAIPLDGGEIHDLISSAYFDKMKEYPNGSFIKEVKGKLQLHGRMNGKPEEVFRRIGHRDGKVYLDLANGKYAIVTNNSVMIENSCDVLFCRSKSMLPLPIPVFREDKSGIENLGKLLNVEKEDKFLVVAWLMSAFMPHGTCPVMVLHGEQGSAKSSSLRVLKNLIDPCTVPLQSMPSNEGDMFVSASKNKVLVFDNISKITPKMSDALCRVVSGSGISKRKLFTDVDECCLSVKCMVALNGIGAFVTRGDLLSRSIIINTPVIGPANRRTEQELSLMFEKYHPEILGGLLTGVMVALQDEGAATVSLSSRLADLTQWTKAWTPAFSEDEDEPVAKLEENWQRNSGISLRADMLGEPLLDLFQEVAPWEGTPTELFAELNELCGEEKHDKFWPTSAAVFGTRLERLKPSLRLEGYNITSMRTSKARLISIEHKQ